MQPPYPSPVPTWHNTLYPAIDPLKRPKSHEGQTVIVTGAGSGIGRATAKGFATAGAKHVVLIGRRVSALEETKAQLSGTADISIFAADVTDEAAMREVADKLGAWDVLILNAAYMPTPGLAAKADVGEYWRAYETNVKGALICANAFFPTGNTTRAVALAVITGSIVFPTDRLVGLSGYQCSKWALVKTMEFLAAENPSIFCASVHPGMVDTDTFRKAGATPDMLPMDDVTLSAGFMAWLSLPEAQFLNGRLVWANWDVEELKAKAEDIAAGNQLTVNVEGWPFLHSAPLSGA